MKLAPLFALVLTLELAGPAAAAADPGGQYVLKGWNPGTAASAPVEYTGTLTISRNGDFFLVDWATPDVAHGVGVLTTVGGKRFLSCAVQNGQEPAVVLFEVSDDGKHLKGDWGMPSTTKAGHEVCDR